MRRAWVWTGALLAQLALLVWTAFPPWTGPGTWQLGLPTWHHNAALAVTALLAAIFFKTMTRDRRVLGVGVFVTTVLAVLSAFLLLYLKQDLKDTGLKDWAKWWHVTWSWFALAFFAGHTWVNRLGLVRSLGRLRRGVGGILAYDGVLVLVLAAIPLTWSDWGARVFTDPIYIPLTLYTWLVLLVPSYGVWIQSVRLRRLGRTPSWLARPATQAFVDGWLFPMTILANVSGFPILWFGTKDTVLKYVAKYWHTWPSIAMAILVFAHTVQFWPAMRKHMAAPSPQRNAARNA